MFKNYFKIAIAVLKRKKLYTFISLFGISFTLTILMVTTAFTDKMFRDSYPNYKKDRCLYVHSLEEENTKDGSSHNGTMSLYFIENYVKTLKTPEKVAFVSNNIETSLYVNNKKIRISYNMANPDFFNVMSYSFTEGKPFVQQNINNKDRVAIISANLKKSYFGNTSSALGKSITIDTISYKVIGVYKDAPKIMENLAGDIYIPYKHKIMGTGLVGRYKVILLAKTKNDVAAMKAEFNQMIKKVAKDQTEFDVVRATIDDSFEDIARKLAGDYNNTGVKKLIWTFVLFIFLFLLLPTINLVNINMTRIIERSSEIGVRKAFGASSKTLVYQFITENIILTFFGGLIGIVLSIVSISVINNSSLIPNINLSLNLVVLGYSLLICFVFGIISGVYPAWRMSKLNVVTALKAK